MIKKQIAAIALALWLTIISVFMLFAERIDLVEFYILALIGTLVIVEFMEPYYVQPGYVRYIRYLIAAGILIFIVVVADVLMEILGLEIVF
jgi:antibiotic biosynthesis monooxygenase (ABM) superfamily enzyme